jgi:hypothetical protein
MLDRHRDNATDTVFACLQVGLTVLEKLFLLRGEDAM